MKQIFIMFIMNLICKMPAQLVVSSILKTDFGQTLQGFVDKNIMLTLVLILIVIIISFTGYKIVRCYKKQSNK